MLLVVVGMLVVVMMAAELVWRGRASVELEREGHQSQAEDGDDEKDEKYGQLPARRPTSLSRPHRAIVMPRTTSGGGGGR